MVCWRMDTLARHESGKSAQPPSAARVWRRHQTTSSDSNPATRRKQTSSSRGHSSERCATSGYSDSDRIGWRRERTSPVETTSATLPPNDDARSSCPASRDVGGGQIMNLGWHNSRAIDRERLFFAIRTTRGIRSCSVPPSKLQGRQAGVLAKELRECTLIAETKVRCDLGNA